MNQGRLPVSLRLARSALARYLGATTVLVGSSVPAAALVGRHYGADAGRRFRTGMTGTLFVQQCLVGMAIAGRRRQNSGVMHRLTLVDMLTLSRGCAGAALVGLMTSGVRDRRGPAGWLGWCALVYGAIVCDWLDGPIARHLGTSELGALIDLEADSWLTLCAAASAATWGELPGVVIAAPVGRYVLLFTALQNAPYAALHVDEPAWVRRMGIAQMLLFVGALAPFGGRLTRTCVRLAAPIQSPLQLWGLLRLHRRSRS